jgi:hypothetical protein
VLARYGNTTGMRMPSRTTLAARIHKKSVDSVDRALRELEACGAVTVERRTVDGRHLTNRYNLHTSHPATDSQTTSDDLATEAGRRVRPPSVETPQLMSARDGLVAAPMPAPGRNPAAGLASHAPSPDTRVRRRSPLQIMCRD